MEIIKNDNSLYGLLIFDTNKKEKGVLISWDYPQDVADINNEALRAICVDIQGNKYETKRNYIVPYAHLTKKELKKYNLPIHKNAL